jgi:hypothetical protein
VDEGSLEDGLSGKVPIPAGEKDIDGFFTLKNLLCVVATDYEV